jgi:hypothetical protein
MAYQLGWMAIACWAEMVSPGQISKGPGWLVQALNGSRTGTGG